MTEIMTDEQANIITEQDIRTGSDKAEVGHYVKSPNDNETNHAYVMRARLEGFPVTALCGWTWVPKRMASDLPVCSECLDIFNSYPDDGGGLPHE